MAGKQSTAALDKTIEKLGANLVEEVLPPKDYIFYDEEMKIQRIYILEID